MMNELSGGWIVCLASSGFSTGEAGSCSVCAILACAALAGVLFGLAGLFVAGVCCRRLRRSAHAAEYLKLLSETMPCPIFIRELGGRGRYLFSSRDHAARFGLAPEELTGRSERELAGKDGYPAEICYSDRTVLEGGGRSVTLEIGSADGSGRKQYLRGISKSVRRSDGRRLLIGIATDVTELELARRRLAEAERFQRAVFDRISSGIFLKDSSDDLRYCIWNRAMEKILRVSRGKVIGKTDFEVAEIAPFAASFRKADEEVLERNGESSFVEELLFAPGDKTVCRTAKIAFSEENGHTFLLGTVTDITREVELEEKQRRLIGRLRELVRNERLLNACLRIISVEPDFDRAVREILARIGKTRSADRSFVFQLDGDRAKPGSGLEWTGNDIPSLFPALRKLGPEKYDDLYRRLVSDGEIVIDRGDETLRNAESAVGIGNRDDQGNLLLCGVRDGERLWGVLGIDFVRTRREISDADRETLRSVGRLLLLAEERRKRLAQLADGDAFQRQLVENISIPLAIIDRDRRIVAVNRATVAITGRPIEELIGVPCHRGLCLGETAPVHCPFDRIRASGCQEVYEFKRGDRFLRVTCQPIYDRGGELAGIFESAVDLTEIRKQQRILAEAVKRAEAADRAKSLFLAMMSHELRTPLNAVIGFSELLQDGALPSDRKLEYLQSINFSGRVLLSQINDLLDLTKLEAGEMKLQPIDADLAGLVQELYAMFRQKAQEKGLRFFTECPAGIPLLRLDETRIRQILLNLLGNALKFTERGSITLRVRFTPAEDGRTVALVVSVADTGPGISEEYMGRIFEPFSQDDAVRGANVMQGTGLGLSIARLWAERMDGTLALESKLGEGSTFTLSIPRVEAVSGKSVEVPPAAGVGTLPISGCSILLVDDVRMNLKVLDAMLGRLGCVCRCAESGEEALRMLDSFSPDWVFTDLWMPGINGAEMVCKLRERPDAVRLRIAIVTADVGAEESFPMEGADAILLKPVTLDKIRRLFALPDRCGDGKPPVIV